MLQVCAHMPANKEINGMWEPGERVTFLVFYCNYVIKCEMLILEITYRAAVDAEEEFESGIKWQRFAIISTLRQFRFMWPTESRRPIVTVERHLPYTHSNNLCYAML